MTLGYLTLEQYFYFEIYLGRSHGLGAPLNKVVASLTLRSLSFQTEKKHNTYSVKDPTG